MKRTARSTAQQPRFDTAAILASLPAGIAVLDREGTVLFANAALQIFAGPEGLTGIPLRELNARLGKLHLAGLFARVLSTGRPCTATDVIPRGERKPPLKVRVSLAPAAGPPGQVLLSIEDVSDVEASRPAEAGLLEQAAASSDDAVLAIGADGSVRAWNRGARRIFGYADREFGALSLGDLLPESAAVERLHPSALSRSGSVRNAQAHARTKSGGRIPVLVTASAVRDGGAQIAASLVVKELAELHQLQEKTLEAERLKTVLETVVSLNHEINNPLAIVMGNLQLLLRKFEKENETTRVRLQAAHEAGRRISEVIRRLTNLVEPVETEYLSGRGIRMIDVRRSRAR